MDPEDSLLAAPDAGTMDAVYSIGISLTLDGAMQAGLAALQADFAAFDAAVAATGAHLADVALPSLLPPGPAAPPPPAPPAPDALAAAADLAPPPLPARGSPGTGLSPAYLATTAAPNQEPSRPPLQSPLTAISAPPSTQPCAPLAPGPGAPLAAQPSASGLMQAAPRPQPPILPPQRAAAIAPADDDVPLPSALRGATSIPPAAPVPALANRAGAVSLRARDGHPSAPASTRILPAVASNTGSARSTPSAAGQPPGAPGGDDEPDLPTEGKLMLDGRELGRWVIDLLAREAGTPPNGVTGPDPRLSLLAAMQPG
jgi:hypothetical protein